MLRLSLYLESRGVELPGLGIVLNTSPVGEGEDEALARLREQANLNYDGSSTATPVYTQCDVTSAKTGPMSPLPPGGIVPVIPNPRSPLSLPR